jgi:hypothetical protein
MLLHPRPLLAALALYVAAVTSAGAQADVRALASLWKQHVRAPADHATVVQGVQQMAAQHAESPLLGIARGLGAWHALAAGQTNTAFLFLTPLLAERADPVSVEARTLAQRWLTRLDREKVRDGLKLYYRNHVEFPAALSALSELAVTNRPPMADRFGRAWKYELAAMKRLATMRAQRYNLTSFTLGDDSDLGTMLRRPYGGGLILWKPERFIGGAEGGPANVVLVRGNEKMVLSEGAKQSGVTLAYSRAELVALTDGDYWWLFAR